MEKPSLKQEIISKLAILTSDELLQGTELALVTSCGLILGKINENEPFIGSIINKITNEYRDKFGEIDTSDKFFILSDVTINSGGTCQYLESTVVFYDQIIGVSLGNNKTE